MFCRCELGIVTATATSVPTKSSYGGTEKADDTLVAIHNDHIQPLHDYLNSIHSHIKWTKEIENHNRIAMLDVHFIHNPECILDHDVYRKPTHTNQYIHFDSHA